MDLGDGAVGKETNWSVGLENGKIKLGIKYDGKQADVSLVVDLDAGLFLDKLAEAIPGEIDDSIIKVVKVALGAAV